MGVLNVWRQNDRLPTTNFKLSATSWADFINFRFYLHPKFKGSWSIKNVLPVMVLELNYDEMEIGKGDQAMMAWWELINDMLSMEDAEKTKTALLAYCKLDTLAMVKIWEKLLDLST